MLMIVRYVIIKLIQLDPTNGKKGMHEPFFRTFLKHCTGSDVILVDKIPKEFVSCSIVAQQPTVHTCDPMMENFLNACDNWGVDII